MTLRVGVIGAGIVGACCAIELVRAGHQVSIIEPETPGGEQAASYGNGAWISPASVVPMSMPGLWKKIPGYLLDREGPLVLRLSAIPAMAGWLTRFLMAGRSVAKVEATAHALAVLLHDAAALHRALADEAGSARLIEQRGLLYAYADRAAFAAEALAWRLRRDNGVAWREIDGAELHAMLPMLAPRYGFGALVESGAHCRDPGAYVEALVACAVRRGVRLVSGRATGFDIAAGRLRAVLTDSGPIALDRVVIAAGIASAVLAQAAGDRVPLASERGYHAVIEHPGFALPLPVMPADGKMANTPTDRGLRIAGQVELAAPGAAPDWHRAEILLRHARATYPGLKGASDLSMVRRWMGHRPSTPDGLPVLGIASGCPDVIHAFGHGHVGLAAAPASARIVAELVAGGTVPAQAAPYSARRFS